MKKLIFCVIFALTCSLAFSATKPCCKKKAGKGAIACKVNQANIEDNKNIKQNLVSNVLDENENAVKCAGKCNALNENSSCATDSKKAWWMFWKKNNNANCPCKQAQINANKAVVAK